MSSDFERSLKFVLEHETVYAKNHYGDMAYAIVEDEEGDSGGRTKFGLDSASHPELDLDTLTVEEAALVYKRCYWERAHCQELPWPLCQVQFDGAVNTGIGQQMKFLQRAVDVKADGAWGPNTRKAVESTINEIGLKALSIFVCNQKETFYRGLVETKPQTARFLKGWLNRLNDLRKDCDLA
jgi:lysozyme family protein